MVILISWSPVTKLNLFNCNHFHPSNPALYLQTTASISLLYGSFLSNEVWSLCTHVSYISFALREKQRKYSRRYHITLVIHEWNCDPRRITISLIFIRSSHIWFSYIHIHSCHTTRNIWYLVIIHEVRSKVSQFACAVVSDSKWRKKTNGSCIHRKGLLTNTYKFRS